jgi:hypothetical protein
LRGFTLVVLCKHGKLEGSHIISRNCIKRDTWYLGPYAGLDYSLTLCRLQTCQTWQTAAFYCIGNVDRVCFANYLQVYFAELVFYFGALYLLAQNALVRQLYCTL